MANPFVPPAPRRGQDLHVWALQLVEYLTRLPARATEVQPHPIMLSHQTTGEMPRAIAPETRRNTGNGILMFDPVIGAPVYSQDGVWEQIGTIAWRGAWDPAREYRRGDIVMDNGWLAIAKLATTNRPFDGGVIPDPVSTTPDWDLMLPSSSIFSSDLAAVRQEILDVIAALTARVEALENGI